MKKIVIIMVTILSFFVFSYPAYADIGDYNFPEIFNSHGSIMLIIDSDSGDIIEANRAAVAFYGFPYEKLIKMNIDQINTLSSEALNKERQAAAAEKRNYFLFSHRLANGEIRNVEVYSYPFKQDGKTLLYSIVQDITSKKQLEQTLRIRTLVFITILIILAALQFIIIIFLKRSLIMNKKTQYELKQSKEEYQALFENMREGFALSEIIYDNAGKAVDYRFLKVNKAFEKVTKLNREDIIDRTVLEVFPKTESYWIENMGQVGLSGNPMYFRNYSIELKSYFSVYIFSPEKGKAVMMFYDITKSIESQKKLVSIKEELAALNILKDKLVTVVANDIRESVALLVNLSELLVEEQDVRSDDSKEIIQSIKEQSRNAYSMVENLREWFVSKEGGGLFTPMELQLASLVQEVANTKKYKAEAKGIQIKIEIPEDITVFADKETLELVLRNLLSNAIKYTFKNGIITIKAKVEKNKVELSVCDTGTGIPQERIQLLFQDVECNSKAGTEGEKGAGLGLFICSAFIQRIGGELWVDSTPGVGSTFFVSIPAKDEDTTHNQV